METKVFHFSPFSFFHLLILLVQWFSKFWSFYGVWMNLQSLCVWRVPYWLRMRPLDLPRKRHSFTNSFNPIVEMVDFFHFLGLWDLTLVGFFVNRPNLSWRDRRLQIMSPERASLVKFEPAPACSSLRLRFFLLVRMWIFIVVFIDVSCFVYLAWLFNLMTYLIGSF